MAGANQYSAEERRVVRDELRAIQKELEATSAEQLAHKLNVGLEESSQVRAETLRKALLDEPTLGRKVVALVEGYRGKSLNEMKGGRTVVGDVRYPAVEELAAWAEHEGHSLKRIAMFRARCKAFSGPVGAAEAQAEWERAGESLVRFEANPDVFGVKPKLPTRP